MLDHIEEALAESADALAGVRATLKAVRDSFDGLDRDGIQAAVTDLERMEADLARIERAVGEQSVAAG